MQANLGFPTPSNRFQPLPTPPPYALASLGLPPPRARDALGVVGFAGASPRPGSLEKSAKTLGFLPSRLEPERNLRSFAANQPGGMA